MAQRTAPEERKVVRVGFGGGTPEEDHGLQWAQCRQAALGHQWRHDPKPIDPELNKWGYRPPLSMPYECYGFRSSCTYCHTDKVKWVAARGYETATRYYHPDGYSRTGEEALDAEEWRKVWMVTTIADAEREQKHGNGNGGKRKAAS